MERALVWLLILGVVVLGCTSSSIGSRQGNCERLLGLALEGKDVDLDHINFDPDWGLLGSNWEAFRQAVERGDMESADRRLSSQVDLCMDYTT